MTRVWITALILAVQVTADSDTRQPAEPVVHQEPPEEDIEARPKEYSFNPLQAEKEITVGKFYMKKGSYKAALRRFQEALKWDPSSGGAWRWLGDAHEKLKDRQAARDAYEKYLKLEPDSKDADEIRRKLTSKR